MLCSLFSRFLNVFKKKSAPVIGEKTETIEMIKVEKVVTKRGETLVGVWAYGHFGSRAMTVVGEDLEQVRSFYMPRPGDYYSFSNSPFKVLEGGQYIIQATVTEDHDHIRSSGSIKRVVEFYPDFTKAKVETVAVYSTETREWEWREDPPEKLQAWSWEIFNRAGCGILAEDTYIAVKNYVGKHGRATGFSLPW